MADRKNADEIEFLDFEDISTESKKHLKRQME